MYLLNLVFRTKQFLLVGVKTHAFIIIKPVNRKCLGLKTRYDKYTLSKKKKGVFNAPLALPLKNSD